MCLPSYLFNGPSCGFNAELHGILGVQSLASPQPSWHQGRRFVRWADPQEADPAHRKQYAPSSTIEMKA
jgi:hypothetical protein